MVPGGLFFCMGNPTIFRKRLIRVNGTRWSVQMKQHLTNFHKKDLYRSIHRRQFSNKMAYKGQ